MTARCAAAQNRLAQRAQPTAAETAAHEREMKALRQSVLAQCEQAKQMRRQHMAQKAGKK